MYGPIYVSALIDEFGRIQDPPLQHMVAQILINQAILQQFRAVLKLERLAHAYLFVGPQLSGKSETALAVARLINCETSGGDCSCASCQKIASGNHPDVYVIGGGEEPGIKIDDVRFLLSRVQLRPYEARFKVFILKNVETLTAEGANALLKTLEEPSKNTLMILTTSVPEANLDTIRSRCQTVQFFPASHGKLAEILRNDYHVEAQQAQCLAAFSEGCLGRARHLADAKFFVKKNKTIDQFLKTSDWDTSFKKMLSDKTETRQALQILLSVVRDLILLKSGADSKQLIHQDRAQDLNRWAGGYRFEELTAISAQIVNTAKLLNDNLNVKMSMSLLKERIWR